MFASQIHCSCTMLEGWHVMLKGIGASFLEPSIIFGDLEPGEISGDLWGTRSVSWYVNLLECGLICCEFWGSWRDLWCGNF